MRNKNEDKHQRILDAAVKVFARKGFYQSKVSEIAKAAGVADGTIYLYFKNKEDLLISVFEVEMQALVSKFRSAIAAEKDPPSQLRKIIAMHLSELQAYPELAAVFQVELRQSSRFMREYKKLELKQYLDLIGGIIEEGQRSGHFRQNLPVGLVKRAIFGTLDELVSTWVLAGNRYDLESLADSVTDIFLNGIRQDASLPEKN
ncbi:TetR/AcrR family transcriptional regulator [Desulforhabdus amnigena]|jgi:TetR/AcrR family fatty acid metabolism transcriptional regulator|uniref:Fatty acid metabolism regulator protein n=1 Tax=Desulforhabdus amnigena TaxID=40218 RepID=A0A9W6CWG1_9BACT|nr:TetR/AcrR family transcriptional regulator [Desulforhabdus amnigena]NLJ28861.1 TetR/AcrR family transcriptional regulator [Deltaproteobacteria bacterium]GLI33121.1 fatty acid metabolism regulator protein [Desulforhabdus amnigena]